MFLTLAWHWIFFFKRNFFSQSTLANLIAFSNVYANWSHFRLATTHPHQKLWRVPLQARIQGRWNGWIFTPLFLSPLLSFFSYPSNIEIIFDFSDIITKIHPPFQNPGSTLAPQIKMLRQNYCKPSHPFLGDTLALRTAPVWAEHQDSSSGQGHYVEKA